MTDMPEISIERMIETRVREGEKPYRAHIVGADFNHHAEGDSPQEALVLAAMRWHRYAKKS